MTPLLVAAGLGVLVGAGLQSATGAGFALAAAPLLFSALEPAEAVGLLIVLSFEISLLTLGTERRRPRPLRRDTAVIVAAALPGALAGVAALRALSVVQLQIALTLGVLGTLFARRRAARGGEHRPPRAWSAPLAGFAAGALTTSTTTNGPPLLVHLLGRRATPGQVRDTMTVCFLGLSAVGATALALTGTSEAMPGVALLAAMAPLAALGQLAGRPLFERLAAGAGYERVLTGVLLVSVLTGLAAQLA